MKAIVKETGFKPITVELVIENEVELAWLKAVSNANISNVRESERNAALLENFNLGDIRKAQLDFYDLMDEL